MCIFICGFRVSAGLVLVMDFHPNGFGFGFRFRVLVLGARRLHPIRTRPVAILTAGGSGCEKDLGDVYGRGKEMNL